MNSLKSAESQLRYRSVERLGAGARVALVAPAGPLRGEEDLARAVENVRAMGWEVVVGAHVLSRVGYLAGADGDRLEDLNRALRDSRVDGVWCLRGGYGVTRILDGVDYDALRVRPRAVIGYSDITALHGAIGRMSGVVSFHGPTARTAMSAFSMNSFTRAVVFGEDSGGAAHGARVIRRGVARGRLAGGNLALLASLVGTRYLPDFDGAVLVLEDVNEAVYRVDRMLGQLVMSGALRGVRGIGFGQCTECEDGDGGERGLEVVLREVADLLNVPCVMGLPIGHVDDQWTVPLGAVGVLDADGLTLGVE